VDFLHSSRSGTENERARASVRCALRDATWVGSLCFLLLGACSTVKPQDKEFLSDPAMTYGSGGETDVQEQHVLENREGAAGGGVASGGGCGCN